MGNDWLTDAAALFTTFGANLDITPALVAERVESAEQDGFTAFMCFVQDEGYALWPSDVVERSPRCPDVDVVGLLAEECRRRGLRFVPQWMGCHVQTLQMRQHSSWQQRDALGIPTAALCLNSPFGGLLLDQIVEVVERYDVDGVYIDGLYARAGGCYCDACRSQFREVFGHDIPRPDTRDEGRPGTGGHWLDFSSYATVADLDRFRFDTVASFCRRLRAGLDRRSGSTALILDTLGAVGGYQPNGQDLGRLAAWVDAFALECYPDQIREPSWHTGLECELLRAETARPIWLLRWLARDPDGNHVPVPEATVELFAADCLSHAASPAPVEMNLYSVDDTLRPAVTKAISAVRRARELAAGTRPVPYAVILHSEATKRTFAAERPRDYLDALSGAYLALTEAHLPFTVATEKSLPDLLDHCRVVVLPNAVVLEEDTVARLRVFVEAGGGLVATYRSGFHAGGAPTDTRLDESALADLFGFESAGVGWRRGRIGTEWLGGQEPVTYYRTGDDHPVLRGLKGRLFSFTGPYLRLVAADGEVLAQVVESDYRVMDGNRWFGWYPGKDEAPLAIARRLGAGRTVYFAAPLDAVFFRQGWPEAGQLLAQAVGWAAGTAPPIDVRAPAAVEIGLRHDPEGGRYVVSLVTRATNDLYALGPGGPTGDVASSSASAAGTAAGTARQQHPRYLVPIPDVSVTLDWPGRATPKVTAVNGHEVEATRTADTLRLTVNRLCGYESIIIESEG